MQIAAVQGSIQQLQTREKLSPCSLKGGENSRAYRAKGESLWTIARENDLTVAELQEMNPSKGTYLQPGDILNLTKIEPLVTVA